MPTKLTKNLPINWGREYVWPTSPPGLPIIGPPVSPVLLELKFDEPVTLGVVLYTDGPDEELFDVQMGNAMFVWTISLYPGAHTLQGSTFRILCRRQSLGLNTRAIAQASVVTTPPSFITS